MFPGAECPAGDVSVDPASLQNLMQLVLSRVATTDATSIALPLLGAGGAGWPPALAASALVAQVIHAAKNCTLGGKLEVRQHTQCCIVLFD